MEKLKSIACDPSCGFMVRSHEENEVIDVAESHVKKIHPTMNITRDDLMKKLREV